jgi:hypothetical protein
MSLPLWCKIYLIKKNKKMGAVCGPFILAKAWIKKKFNLTNYIHQNCFNMYRFHHTLLNPTKNLVDLYDFDFGK